MYSRIFLIMERFTNGEEDPSGLLIASLVKVLIASLVKVLIASLMKVRLSIWVNTQDKQNLSSIDMFFNTFEYSKCRLKCRHI